MPIDIRDLLFSHISKEEMTAAIQPDRVGILSGIEDAILQAQELGLTVVSHSEEGDQLQLGKTVLVVKGPPKQMTMAEDLLIGLLAKPSGIATAAAAFCKEADGQFRVVCGAWKKVHPQVKQAYRRAAATGGCGCRMVDKPMLYLDKNYVAMLGGIKETLEHLPKDPEINDRIKVIQVKGNNEDIGLECWTAAEFGADVIFVDTGCLEDLEKVKEATQYMRHVPPLAFAGNVSLEDIRVLKNYPISVVDVGKSIVDAPMVDMRFDVVPVSRPHTCSHK